MARITIQINTDNAAFDDDAVSEVSRILKFLAGRVEMRGLGAMDDGFFLHDVNGNRVGKFEYRADQE